MKGTKTPDPTRVLLVDDDPEFAEMYRFRLQADGHVVEWAPNGRVGLELVRTWKPDLALLDMRMPEMDGIEFLRALRGDPLIAALPVVVLSNYSDEALRAKAERLAVVEWRQKTDTTPTRISNWVRRGAARLPEETLTV